MQRIVKASGAVLGLCAAAAMAVPAQTFTMLQSFDGTDGSYPGAVVQATDGNLHGTTVNGGANPGYYGSGAGTFFKITPAGALTALYSFCSATGCTDGDEPAGGLVQGDNGNFYGATEYGGANCATSGGCGVVFEITPTGVFTSLYSFCALANCADGGNPRAGLVLGANGDFYGTTGNGGANGGGTFFSLTPSGTLTTLHSFCSAANCTDGASPAGLVLATNGDFYGTTVTGGTSRASAGTVYKMTPAGTLTTLYSFCSRKRCVDGQSPNGVLIQATDGDFYGTTKYGGGNGPAEGDGTVFKIAPSGRLTTLYSFCAQSNCTDGFDPSGLVQATDGNFYGTTVFGGLYFESLNGGSGTLFKLTPAGAVTTLYSFCSQTGCPEGDAPESRYDPGHQRGLLWNDLGRRGHQLPRRVSIRHGVHAVGGLGPLRRNAAHFR